MSWLPWVLTAVLAAAAGAATALTMQLHRIARELRRAERTGDGWPDAAELVGPGRDADAEQWAEVANRIGTRMHDFHPAQDGCASYPRRTQ